MKIAPQSTTALARRTLARVLPWQKKTSACDEAPSPVARTPLRRALWTLFVASAVAALWSIHVWQFSHRVDDDRVVATALPFWRTFEALELRLYDGRFATRGVIEPRSKSRIAIVAIDDFSLDSVGQWPWPRSLHAQLANELKAAGARVVALDIDFSSRQNPQTKNGIAQLSAADSALVAAAQSGTVIAPSFLGEDEQNQGKASLLVAPFEEFDATMPDVSLAALARDSDGGVRRWPFRAIFNPDSKDARAVVGSFANLAVAIAQKRLDGAENKDYESDLLAGRARVSTQSWKPQSSVEFPLAINHPAASDAPRVARTLLQFWGPPGTFPTYSYARVLHEMTPQQKRAAFADRIVFMGATAHILKDTFPMPPIANAGESPSSEISGVEMHASAAAMLLDGVTLREASLSQTLAALWAMTLGCAFLMLALRERAAIWGRAAQANWRESGFRIARGGQIHDLVWLGTTFTAAVLPLLLFWQFGQMLFNSGLWLPSGYILWSSSGASLLILARNFAEEAAERRKTLAQFARRVSHDVMEELLSHPEEEYPRTRRVAASVLFADLEGFTTFSEQHEPEDVVAALNELFGRLEPIVYEHGGTVDKYIGDAIMAFFGAPIPRFDHAARSLSCAVAMQEAVRRFREETGVEFYLRVGVHSGDVIVGCVGSQERSDYTVIGDTVNLASRLEGQNKDFNSWILCSSQTIEAAPGVVWADAARAQIKGKANSVDVYIVRGLRGAPPCDTRWGRELDEDSARAAEISDGMPQLAAPHSETEGAALQNNSTSTVD